METFELHFKREHNYEILLGVDIFPQIVAKLSRFGFDKICAVITNETIEKWYLEPLLSELKKRNFICEPIILPDGEKYKTLETANQIYQKLLALGLTRKSPLIALGGGVIGDITGFCAATFLRGVPFIQLPTTLLAMVDASIGGKVAVNLPQGKNLIGSFYQPSLVGIDLSTLKTLPSNYLAYGLVECIKHGLIADRAYFKFLTNNCKTIKSKSMPILQRVVRRSLNIKKAIVEEDELDTGKRAILNFGHTFGHALEVIGEFLRFHHGEAVGLGMLMAIEASREIGILTEDYSNLLQEILQEFNLPTRIPREIRPESFLSALSFDKKKEDEEIKFILPVNLGTVQTQRIPFPEVLPLLKKIFSVLYD